MSLMTFWSGYSAQMKVGLAKEVALNLNNGAVESSTSRTWAHVGQSEGPG